MVMSSHYVLAAGGTGGHMIPAHALAEELLARGHRVALITDDRGARIPGLFDNVQVHILPAGRLGGGPAGWFRAARNIMTGRAMALRLYETFLPSAVIGFGGYPAFPALLAGRRERIPTLLHEQNAVLGRVNRLMAGRVDAIATAYDKVQRLPPKAEPRVHLIGNPVRDEVLALRDQPYPALSEDGIFRVLVTGGSQGASILSDVVPAGLALLPEHFRRRLQVTQQCRAEDMHHLGDSGHADAADADEMDRADVGADAPHAGAPAGMPWGSGRSKARRTASGSVPGSRPVRSTRSARSLAACGRPTALARAAALASAAGSRPSFCICLASSTGVNLDCAIARAPPALAISFALKV